MQFILFSFQVIRFEESRKERFRFVITHITTIIRIDKSHVFLWKMTRVVKISLISKFSVFQSSNHFDNYLAMTELYFLKNKQILQPLKIFILKFTFFHCFKLKNFVYFFFFIAHVCKKDIISLNCCFLECKKDIAMYCCIITRLIKLLIVNF